MKQLYHCRRNLLLALVFILAGSAGKINAQEEPLADLLKSFIQHETFSVNALVQAGFRYSLRDDDFLGGRTFEAANARLSFSGTLDGRFYYSILFNLVNEPNLLDAFIGYRYSDGLNIKAGAMKPSQTLDFIPEPGSTDFIDRAIITGHLVESREIGISAEGDIDDFYYFAGIFNGSGLAVNTNNRFYRIGRLQYTFHDLVPGTVKVALQGSHGDSEGVRSGSTGPVLRGKRSIYGFDARLESGQILLATEYLAGYVESADLPDRKERICGSYITGGYQFLERTMALGRLQTWRYREEDFRDYQITLGINHSFTGLTSFQFNLDSYFPDNRTNHYGISMILQVEF